MRWVVGPGPGLQPGVEPARQYSWLVGWQEQREPLRRQKVRDRQRWADGEPVVRLPREQGRRHQELREQQDLQPGVSEV